MIIKFKFREKFMVMIILKLQSQDNKTIEIKNNL